MRKALAATAAIAVLGIAGAVQAADTLRVVNMASQDPKKEGPKCAALAEYLKAGSPQVGEIQVRVAKNYSEAAQLFKGGEADAMVAGSFVAAVFIKKDLAKPVARPLGVNGVSTYEALVVAQAGTKPFAGIADFRGKKVAYTGRAFFRKIGVARDVDNKGDFKMGRGRKKVPTNLHILHGNPGKRKLNDQEPKPDIKIPPVPQWLGEEAKQEWLRIKKIPKGNFRVVAKGCALRT